MKLERRRHAIIAENAECGGIRDFLSVFCVQKEETVPFPIDDAIKEK